MLVALVASGAAAGQDAEERQVLSERAQSYWQARASRSAKVMEFYAPVDKGGPKDPVDVSEFGNVRYKSWEIDSVSVEGDRGLVEIRIQADYNALSRALPRKLVESALNRTVREEWLKVDGVWYKKPIPRGFGKGFRAQGTSAPAGAAPAEPQTQAGEAVETAEVEGAK